MNEDQRWSGADVSRETLSRLQTYQELLNKWNPKINLVSRGSLTDSWTRHFLDSIQVFDCVKPNGHWVDLGSGGGFPGMVVAILAAEKCPNLKVTLVESDQRKCAFLRTVAREAGVQCDILSRRIEEVEPKNADILSARALTSLTGLLGFADRHLSKTGVAVFPKGASWKKELDEASREWSFSVSTFKSKTDDSSVILRIEGVSHA